MKSTTIIFFGLMAFCLLPQFGSAQKRVWTEADRIFLVQNLERTRDELIKETDGLSIDQWHFKPDEKSWSIAQVMEHMGINERTFLWEATVALWTKPEPELDAIAISDSSYMAYMNDPNPHFADKIHTPLGLTRGKDNLTWFLHGRNANIDFIRDTPHDLKAYYTFRHDNRRSVHGNYVVHFGHTDRHLRQIRKIKANPGYPK